VFGVEKLGRVGGLILRLVGALLLITAGLKGYQAVTEPMAGDNIWTNRNFLILTVELELAMGIWLVSGLFKKLAWLAGVFAFVGSTLTQGTNCPNNGDNPNVCIRWAGRYM
jgi:uncharacterized membrane protein YphA (DoxX/SURF4 family)